jgi:hypothetical protein
MGKRHIDHSIKLSPELEHLMKTFRPEFGNATHLRIVNEYADLKHTLTLMGQEKARQYELKKLSEQLEGRFADIQHKERNLIYTIKQNQVK